MANNKFFNYIELKYEDLTNQIYRWLKSQYKKSNTNFTSTSPYGQLLNVNKELFQHNIIYLKNALNVIDIDKTQNKKVIQQSARISGHNVGRAISATGTLKFILKQGIDIQEEIKDSLLFIKDGTVIKNTQNGLKYMVKLNTEQNIYSLSSSNRSFFIPIIQGEYEEQDFTGNGAAMQSFSVNIPNNKQVENFNVQIRLNDTVCELRDRLYDLLPREYGCVVRSGFNGGIDINFGTGTHGIIPVNGSIITVKYVLSDGAAGEILTNSTTWKVQDDILDGASNVVDVNKLFNIEIATPINFAADGESLKFTKAAIPFVSRNFVLGTPKQFIYHLKKLNMFSKVNAYNKLDNNNFSINENVVEYSLNNLVKKVNQNYSKEQIITETNKFYQIFEQYKSNLDDNQIYLFLIPSIEKYFNGNINYFNIPIESFFLSSDEIDKIIQYLRRIETLSLTTTINITQPIMSKYVMHVYIRRYNDANEENIRQEIITKTSDYLLNNDRVDRIPKSDFVKLYKEIDGVDSASVFFVSKKNEDYHKNYMNIPNYNSENMIGIDKVHGDIICELDEYVIIRGGWRDRNDIWYNESTEENGLNSINIVFNGVTQK